MYKYMYIRIIQLILDTLYLLEGICSGRGYASERCLVIYMYVLLEKNGSSSFCVYKYAISAKYSKINRIYYFSVSTLSTGNTRFVKYHVCPQRAHSQ